MTAQPVTPPRAPARGAEAEAGALAVAALRGTAGPLRVFASFRRAVYLAVGEGTVVLTEPTVPRGPLHLRVPDLDGLVVGSEVRMHAGRLVVGTRSFGLSPGWQAAQAGPLVVDRAAPLVAALSEDLEPSAPLDDRQTLQAVRGLLRSRDLVGLVDLLGGWGPGLTPAGDDFLAGVMLVEATFGSDGQRAELPETVQSANTNRISSAYLAAAALGQSIQPAHDLLAALAQGDSAAARRAIAELAGYGASSGLSLAHGVVLGVAVRLEGR